MPLITIEAPSLSPSQKERIGSQIVQAMHFEGINPGSVVVLFQPERSDIFMDGGLLSQAAAVEAAPVAAWEAPAPVAVVPAASAPDYRTKARRSRSELETLKQTLMDRLREKGSLSSFEAQDALGLKDCEWAPATLRRLFTDLEDAQLVGKIGQKRGTRYVWKGEADAPLPPPRLVKADED